MSLLGRSGVAAIAACALALFVPPCVLAHGGGMLRSIETAEGYLKPSLVRIEVEGDPTAAMDRVFAAGGDVVARGRGWFDALLPQEDVLMGTALGLFSADQSATMKVIREDADAELRAFADKQDAGAYHTYAEVKEEIDGYLSEHGDILSYESIGTSVEGRPIHAVRIGGPESEGKPTFLICGLHHSREWISVEPPMATIKWLVEGYATDPAVKQLVDEREIWVIPVLNPDGLEYSQTEYKMWRKNRRDNGDGSIGVDPNRNYGYNWGLPGASDNPRSETYRGPEPFSEPEIQAIRDLAVREGVVSALSFHSYSELVLWPWGYTYDPAPDVDILAYHGTKMGELTGYTPQQSSDLYPTSGDFDDWFYGELGALAYTFELGRQFVPPESEIPEIVEANLKAIRYFLENCADPFPLMTAGSIGDTTDTEGPYPAQLNLSRRYQSQDPVEAAEVRYQLPGAAGPARAALQKKEGGVYEAGIPGTGSYGSVSYHFVVTAAGEVLRYPAEGEFTFEVVESLALVVDDDKGSQFESHYVEALEAVGLPHRVVGPEAVGAQDLLGASVVIWFTGNDSSSSLTQDEQELLAGFLEAGGELLLFGQDIGYDIKGTAFYQDVLKADFVKDSSGEDALAGAAGSFLEGFSDALNQPGAVKQRYPEVVAAREGAASLVEYGSTGKVGALQVEGGNYRLGYFGFGLEGLSSLEAKKQVLERGLAWLTEGRGVRTARRAATLRALGGDETHPAALARLEAAVLDEARRLGARRDKAGLDRLRKELPDLNQRPLLRAFWQSLR